ncbi:TetR/AcrR family transcriptional regulator [Streptomyces spiramenti]|uniref:TetR family transcriptional regulator n=1 Tax=Streptomyces spiramenti TaxID=2720606 RepID=A0ABX1ATF0_9ACTN|nr:TetR family transcriptional regulator [Streptomyces spiramenti]NJP68043.1 TetR family transcriptional regulator [Streptomyces spiramenti]
MRPSSRPLILDAAIRVTEREGITHLTLESVAEEAGLTKGGLMYHFRTREELLVAIQQHLVDTWEGQLRAELGGPPEEADDRARAAAYVRADAHGSVSKAELAFLVEAAGSASMAEPWQVMINRWVAEPRSADDPRMDLFLARLAADGAWLFEATSGVTLPDDVRAELYRRLTGMVDAPATRQPSDTPAAPPADTTG